MMRVVEVVLAIDAILVQRKSACVTRFERQMISSSKKFEPPNWGDACEPKLSKAASLLQHATACGGGGGHTRFSRGSSPHLVVFGSKIFGAREGCIAPSECVGVRVGESGSG